MSEDKLLVTAIDFGTTYSGWAYSFITDYEKNPTNVTASVWSAGQRALVSQKAPTCILVNPDKTFNSFGYEAENNYSNLADEEEHHDYYFFKRFKMMLFDKVGLKRDINLEDDKGKTLPAKTVFTMAIKYLKEHVLEVLQTRIPEIKLCDIQWVLTVPAIWNDAAKQFMREAAVDAGIDNNKLLIALEPEAASLFCRHLPVSKAPGSDCLSLASLKPGEKYMVLDCGGGTVDITVHEVMKDDYLRELHKASGGAWGGTRVDEAFKQMLIRIVGGPVIDKFYKQFTADYIDIFREFEVKKRDLKPDSTNRVVFRLAGSLQELFEDETNENLKGATAQSCLASRITWIGQSKMKCEPSLVKELFKDATDSVVRHVGDLLRDPALRGISVILMVGGFSESAILQDEIRKKFPRVKVIIPEDAGLAVLKGAVMFGHDPSRIAERKSKYTYGVGTSLGFDEGHHPDHLKKAFGGKTWCEGIFHKHVDMDQTVRLHEAQVQQSYNPLAPDQKHLTFRIFASDRFSPVYVTDEGCKFVGKMTVRLPDISKGTDRRVFVRMIFGGTEVSVEATEESTGKVTSATFNCLE